MLFLPPISGYEVDGLENIPNKGPALIVYYHGALPIDHYYFIATCLLSKNRLVKAIGDRFLFKIPGDCDFNEVIFFGNSTFITYCTFHGFLGWEPLLSVLQVSPGSVEDSSRALRDGQILSVAPGGVFEAQFGDETYKLLWGKRIGFAKVALQGHAVSKRL